MEHNIYMKTGEFAKAVGVSKETLFHYDDIGLFSPEYTGDNGYRYYSVYQMETLDTILMLKELDMSLKDIREFLNGRSPDTFLELFDEREKYIDEQIARLRTMKKWMAQRRHKLDTAVNTDFGMVGVVERRERYYTFAEAESEEAKDIYKKAGNLIKEFYASGTDGDYDIAYIQYAHNVENGIYDKYNNSALLMEEKPRMKNYRIMPAGRYLTAYHKGHWNSIGEAYERLLAYRDNNGLKTDSEYIEYYVVDNFIADNIDDYLTSIEVMLK
ncbi:MAG: MerR family transcriptional regulator [[Bacteroides] pectinophilus]|nr:MerR family transcriptional regulator [[Bacteroides] pectinophilus]